MKCSVFLSTCMCVLTNLPTACVQTWKRDDFLSYNAIPKTFETTNRNKTFECSRITQCLLLSALSPTLTITTCMTSLNFVQSNCGNTEYDNLDHTHNWLVFQVWDNVYQFKTNGDFALQWQWDRNAALQKRNANGMLLLIKHFPIFCRLNIYCR